MVTTLSKNYNQINSFLLNYIDLDIAFFLLTESFKDNLLGIKLSNKNKNPEENYPIAIIGYPNNEKIKNSNYKNKSNTKIISFGYIQEQNQLPKQYKKCKRNSNEDNIFLCHNASTLKGNSGSVIYDIYKKESIGIHFRTRDKSKKITILMIFQ